jgi:MYXO-CTERM domain-containing protein
MVTTTPLRPVTVGRAATGLGRALRREYPLFLLGTGTFALHIADDNFFQPQPGTSAFDHLASGLVPLALLAAAASTYPRRKAGLRAVLALTVGFLSVAFGALEAGYYTLAVGPSGDDFTGLLTIPAGLLLLGLGTATLWRTRRRDETLRRRYVRRAVVGLAGIVITYQIGGPLLLTYGATHIQRAAVPAEHLGVAHEDVTLTTSDGLQLEGWYVPSKNGAAVIAFPGRLGTQAHTRMLARHGYGVLLFDRRGEGASEGDGNLFGWGGEKDIFAAIDFLKHRHDVDPNRIGGMGFSVGGELMLQAAAQNRDLAAVVSEGAGTRQLAEEVEELPTRTFLLGLPFLTVKTGGTAVFSNTLPPPKLTDLVSRIAPRPVFLIWAPNGGNAETMNPTYRRLAGDHASIWAMNDARHIKGIAAEPQAYERRVVGFFDDALFAK